jgi:hypothetical protein
MPILEDFKPDLIVNSAGQDNHYTDPITNMNFSAQGYAMLNEKLNPDIAVLEGGYSIQGALPYVNLGIVLAMAGIDYSHVKEPDYDAKVIAQDRRTAGYIKNLADEILEIYFNPPGDRGKPGNYSVRKKSIFYDTDMIREQQVESVMVCEECAGVLKIETVSSLNEQSLCVEVPIESCDRCRKEGYRIYENGKKNANYRRTILINRKDKEYLRG